MTENLIKDISKVSGFNHQLVKTSIYLIRQKYPVKDEDLQDLLMDSYIKYYECILDENLNKQNLFIRILRNTILDFYKKANRISLYSDLNDEDYTFEDNIIEEDTYLYEKDR